MRRTTRVLARTLVWLGATLALASCSAEVTVGSGTPGGEAQTAGDDPATKVGIFYLLWHCPATSPIYTTTLADGYRGAFHWWGRPQLGYYCLSRDASVLRQHALWLRDAGIDFIFVDATNHPRTDQNQARDMIVLPFERLLQEWSQIPGAPRIVPWAPLNAGSDMLQYMLDRLARYPDLAFPFAGKQLALVVDNGSYPVDPGLYARLQAQNTLRLTWGLYNQPGSPWSFLEMCQPGFRESGGAVPCDQRVARNAGAVEQVSITAAYQETYMSNTATAVPKLRGLTFRRQFQTLFDHPETPIATITGWNEWIAQRFCPDGGVSCPTEAPSLFVDAWDDEYNRDLEPGGVAGDYYYRLMKSCISELKRGSRCTASAAADELCCQLLPGAGGATASGSTGGGGSTAGSTGGSTELTVRFLGTCAPNSWCWESGGRQLASILVGRDMIVDFSCWNSDGDSGTCGVARLLQYRIDLDAVAYMLITHDHDDHFDPAEVARLARARSAGTPLRLLGGRDVVDAMNAYLTAHDSVGLLETRELTAFAEQPVGPYLVTPVAANHPDPGVLSDPFVYVIARDGARFLYGADSGCFAGAAQAALYREHLDLVIREGTFAFGSVNCAGGHMAFADNLAERSDWLAHGTIAADTPYVVTHVVAWPPAGCAGRCDAGPGLTVALDGDRLTVRAAPATGQSGELAVGTPIGALDLVLDGIARGWACEPENPAVQIAVHFYVGGEAGSGAPGYPGVADQASEPAVNALCQGGSAHRFYLPIPGWEAVQGQPVFAYGINATAGGGNTVLTGSPAPVH